MLSDQPPEQISRVIGARKSRSSVPFLTNHIIVVTLREDVVSLTSLHVKDLSYADVPIVYLLNRKIIKVYIISCINILGYPGHPPNSGYGGQYPPPRPPGAPDHYPPHSNSGPPGSYPGGSYPGYGPRPGMGGYMGPPPPNGTASPAGPGPNSGDPYGRPGWGQYGPRPGYPPQSGHPPPPSGPPTSSSGPPFGSSGPGGPYPDQYHVSRQLSSSSSWLSVFFGFECRPDFCAGFCTFVHSLFPPVVIASAPCCIKA